MLLFAQFCDLFSSNITIFVLASLLLGSTLFGIFSVSSESFCFPNLTNSSLHFTAVLIFFLLLLFGTDFSFVRDGLVFFNQNVMFFFLFVAFLTILITREFSRSRNILMFEYDIFITFVVLSSIGICFADDFLLVYLFIELQSLCFYLLATYNRNSEFSTESGLKYFIFGGIISSILLLGFSLIYLSFGLTNFEFLSCFVQNEPALTLGLFFLLITFFFKLAAVPFHFWLCDVYDGAIISVTFLFSALPKIILFSLIIKLFLFVFAESSSVWSSLFLIVSISSIFIGSLSALYQKRLKRLFAFSTIAHTGFMLLGFCSISPDMIQALIFYVIVYTFLTILLFSILIFTIVTQTNFPGFISNWVGVGSTNLIAIFSFSFILFSIAGIPPFVGFFSKFSILLAFVSNGYVFSGIVIVLISSVACFYYIRLIKTFLFNKTVKNKLWISSKNSSFLTFNLSVFSLVNFAFVFYPKLFIFASAAFGIFLV